MISVHEAQELVLQHILPAQAVSLPVHDALGYVLAQDLIAPADAPAFNQSAMDGYAIRWEDRGKALPIVGAVAAGDGAEQPLEPGTARRIFTGGRIPEGADTVVIQEHTTNKENVLYIDSPLLQRGANIRLKGSQIQAGAVALQRGSILTAAGIGFIAAMGMTEIAVFKHPRIGIIVTGSELVTPGTPLTRGGTYESNSVMLMAALREIGFTASVVRRIADEQALTLAAMQEMAESCDVVLLTGGVSVCDHDHVAGSKSHPDFTTIFHKVKQKPGKPFLFGKYGHTPLFGLPGNPASVLTCFYVYVAPFLLQSSGYVSGNLAMGSLLLKDAVQKKAGLTVFLKASSDGEYADILPQQESYILKSYAQANCLAVLPEATTAFAAESEVAVIYLPKRH